MPYAKKRGAIKPNLELNITNKLKPTSSTLLYASMSLKDFSLSTILYCNCHRVIRSVEYAGTLFQNIMVLTKDFIH